MMERRGMPSYETVLEVWQQNKRPSCRRLEQILAEQGYQISYRTISRWVENGREAGSKALAHADKVCGVKKEISRVLLSLPEEDKIAADRIVENDVKQLPPAPPIDNKSAGARSQDVELVQAEANIIDNRIKQLVLLSEAELDVVEQKSRKILNIVLTEAAARRANVMVLIPKDTGAFVEAMTEASKQTLTGGLDQTPKAGDMRTINGDVVDVELDTPLASEISKFFQDEGMVG